MRSYDEYPHTAQPATDITAGSTIEDGKLLPRIAAADFQARWTNIQQSFVDEPREAMVLADALVADVMRQLSETFNEQRRDLEDKWSTAEPSTEDLRAAFQRYRAFFDHLLNV